MKQITLLPFVPLPGFSSKHLQTILPSLLPRGKEPLSVQMCIDLGKEDQLCCEVSTPPSWTEEKQTVVMIHGLSGSHASPYMIRMARKIYQRGDRVVRVNLRGTGSGAGLSKLPYHGGNSEDLLKVLEMLKQQTPLSPLLVIGFSLGGNIVLKLAGELGQKAEKIAKAFIAVCAPLLLGRSVRAIEERRNTLYHYFYLTDLRRQARRWMKKQLKSLHEFDDQITAPLWGYKGANEYYDRCSSARFIPEIRHTTHMIFAEDDPFISLEPLQTLSLPPAVRLWTSKQGGHMGFLGMTPDRTEYFWMDHLLLSWIEKLPE